MPRGEIMRRAVEFAEDRGWAVSRTRNNHIRLTRPGYSPIFCSATPSDHRALMNICASLKRARPRFEHFKEAA